MMTNIVDIISQIFKFGEVRDESKDSAKTLPLEPRRAYEWFWPRLLFFNSSGSKCYEEENEEENEEEEEEEESYESPTTEICIEIKGVSNEENSEDEHEEYNEEEDTCGCPEVGGFRRKLGCIYRNAKFGLREGALTGVFLGGALGIYKYVDAVYLKGESGEGGNSSEDDSESTVNDSVIFVTAANGAIAMAVFCTLLCCTRGAIYC